jgi:uncharacterized membrane protein (UPF0127 family)
MVNKILIALFFCAMVFAVFSWYRADAPVQTLPVVVQKPVTIKGTTYSSLIADTDLLRQQGLSYRASLPSNQVMLFIFEKPGVYKFWMKDMNFPIDMVWLNSSKQVVYIEKNVSPSTYPQAFGPNEDTLYVIELNANETTKLSLSVGDTVIF